jgi:hypothetical protein
VPTQQPGQVGPALRSEGDQRHVHHVTQATITTSRRSPLGGWDRTLTPRQKFVGDGDTPAAARPERSAMSCEGRLQREAAEERVIRRRYRLKSHLPRVLVTLRRPAHNTLVAARGTRGRWSKSRSFTIPVLRRKSSRNVLTSWHTWGNKNSQIVRAKMTRGTNLR